jgi:2-hydroxy-6-oxonona-2,4-dienedioate hydrolase
MRVAFAEIEGLQTRYLYAGGGPALLIVHPVGLLADCFHRNIDELAENFTVYVPDLLGHGFTASPDLARAAPQGQFVRHLLAFADHVGLQSYSVLGSSLGGLIAALLYMERPDSIDKLVIIGSGSTFHPPDDFVATIKATAANGSKAMIDATLASCRARLETICFDDAAVDDVLPLIQLTSYAAPDRLASYQAILNGLMETAADSSLRVYDRLEELRVPTLVIQGREDIRSQIAHTEAGIARMPTARLSIYEQCGHLPFYEQPQRFNEEVAQFLMGE